MGVLDCTIHTTLMVILSHKFALFLCNIMADSLVVCIMSRFLLDGLLDIIYMILNTHMLILSFAFT